MENYQKNQLHEILAALQRFLARERLAYREAARSARYSKDARRTRRASHNILSWLVPRVRMLDKLLNQPAASSYYKCAPQMLATCLIECFIAKTHVPDTHEVWQLRFTAENLRVLAAAGVMLPELWLTRWEIEFPGITAVTNDSQAGTLRDLRTAFLSAGVEHTARQQSQLQAVLGRVKAILPLADYQLLVSNLRVPT